MSRWGATSVNAHPCNLLFYRNAIMACDVNGVVVYCTDTASQWQNEYVIQYTVQVSTAALR